jgi:DNA-binding PadR family transcriptional regulator
MPIHHAVLALLEAGPSHGYELKSSFEHGVGPQWGSLNIGHLYQILERLSRDELVRSHRVTQGGGPDRIVYELTPAGRRELAGWLDEPSPRRGHRDDFFLKIMAAARLREPSALRQVLSRQRVYLLQELRNLQALRRDQTDPTVALLLDAARMHVQADLAVIDAAEETLLEPKDSPVSRHETRGVEAMPPAGDRTAEHGGGSGSTGTR